MTEPPPHLKLFPLAVRETPSTRAPKDRMKLLPARGSLPCPGVGTPSSTPVAIIFAMSRRQRVILSFASRTARVRLRSLGHPFEFFGARREWGKVEAESELDFPSPALSGVSLAIRAIPPNDEPASTSAASCRRNVDGGMPCVLRQSSSLDGKTMSVRSHFGVKTSFEENQRVNRIHKT